VFLGMAGSEFWPFLGQMLALYSVHVLILLWKIVRGSCPLMETWCSLLPTTGNECSSKTTAHDILVLWASRQLLQPTCRLCGWEGRRRASSGGVKGWYMGWG
jgi:hypothetical protein